MSETHSTYLHHESLKNLLDVLMAEAMKCAQAGDFEATATILEDAGSPDCARSPGLKAGVIDHLETIHEICFHYPS